MGANQSVYMANGSGQDIHVIASLNPDWAIVDFITDIGLLIAGVEELKGAAMLGELPETLNTIRDLFDRGPEAALALVEAFRKTSVPIDAWSYKDMKDENALGMYLSASGIAGLMGASTVSVMVLSRDGKQLAMYNTGSDDSWIATDREEIVRSKYGSIWQEDPSAGTESWPIQ
ncbi:hypothetical protein ONZ45_g225 [Pleurotus djamor]|nr:hypothetical protein ONZ45_g225 [Pleurotus djamor]